MIKQTLEVVSRWLDAVAAALVAGLGRRTSPRKVKLVEENANTFAIRAGARTAGARVRIEGGHVVGRLPEDVTRILRGSRLELILRSSISVPAARISGTCGGISRRCRARADRPADTLSAEEAVFGWSAPTEAGNERIVVTVAATARAKIALYVQALSELGAQSIAVFAASQGADAGVAPIKVLEHERSGALDVRRIRGGLVDILLLAAVLAGGALGADFIAGGDIAARQNEFARKITERRAAIRSGADTNVDGAAAPSACWSVASTPIRRR
jgi:general secretion pathway protein L